VLYRSRLFLPGILLDGYRLQEWHQAAQPLQAAPAPLQAPSRPVPVLVFELHSDGTSHVALKTTLPADRGSALLRQLLDFGLTASV